MPTPAKPARHQMTGERIDAALESMLVGENVDKLLAGLNAYEQTLFKQLVAELKAGNTDIVDQLWKVDYVRKPPTMQEFITDPHWLGSVTLPSADSQGLFPFWRETLMADFDLDSRVHNVVITGSYGCGKTYCMCIMLLYRIAVAVLLRNPQQFFGLGKGSRILYILLSLTKSVVSETAFGDARNFMANSPFFLETCKFNPDKKYSDFSIPLGKGIYLTAGSKGWHVIGRNTMGVALDEGNWRLEANPDQRAYKLYDEVRTRIKNRFQKVAGFLPAISILASSARDESSFTERVIGDIERARDPKTEIVYRLASYTVKKGIITLDALWFKVAYGLKTSEPKILSGWYSSDGTPVGNDLHEPPPQGMTVVLVPKDYLDAFKRNVISGLQNICGVSIGGGHRFFSSMMEVERAVTLGEASGLKNPADIELMSLSSENDSELCDFMQPSRFVVKRAGIIQPARDPEVLRFAHLDLATRNVAGLSICHVVGRQLVTGLYDGVKGQTFEEYRLLVEYDFICAITAGQTKPINIEKIQNFILWLRAKCGYRFGAVTADTYQSVSPLQMLESRGFKTSVLSMDRSKGPYYSWRTAFEENRIRMYRHNLLLRECEQLLDLPDKIDHPSDGCFVGGTSIKLLDGTTSTLAELEASGKSSFWVYSCLPSGKVVPGLAHSARVTKHTTKLVKVTLDNGVVEMCTPDHKWMLRTGAYSAACELVPGQSLMPLHYFRSRIKYKRGSAEYEQLIVNGKTYPTHRVIAGYYTRLTAGLVVHHYNFKTLDNCPCNLRPMTRPAHNALHAKLAERLKDPEIIKKRVATFKRRYAKGVDPLFDEFRRNKISAYMKEYYATHPEKCVKTLEQLKVCTEQLLRYIASPVGKESNAARLRSRNRSDKSRQASSACAKKTNRRTQDELDDSLLKKVIELGLFSRIEARKRLGGGTAQWKRRFAKWNLNHKVISVELVDVETTAVYDITVETHHNFALASGVFVHNSKDIADACAGSYYTAVTYGTKNQAGPGASEPALYGSEEDTPANAEPVKMVLPSGGIRVAAWTV